jgi:hypothetical protein
MSKIRVHGMKQRHECGCVSDDIQWLEMCEAHRRECAEVHERWNEDRGSSQVLAEEEA